MTNDYPTRIDLCDGKYTVIYDPETGQSECLRYGEPWRELCGDNMVLAMFDRIVELEAKLAAIEAQEPVGYVYPATLAMLQKHTHCAMYRPGDETAGSTPLYTNKIGEQE